MVWGEGFTGWLRQNQPEHLRLGRLGERAAKRHLKQAGLKFLYAHFKGEQGCLLYTSPSPRDATLSRMPSSA